MSWLVKVADGEGKTNDVANTGKLYALCTSKHQQTIVAIVTCFTCFNESSIISENAFFNNFT